MTGQIPSLRALQAFEAVVRCGGVSLAANELGVTHGAVSKQLAGLEQSIGRRLFERRSGLLRPTPEARDFARELSAGFDGITRAARTFGQGSAAKSELVVLAPATFAMHWLLPRLPPISSSGRTIRVQTTQTGEDWRAFRFDVAIQRDVGKAPGYVVEPLLTETLSLIARPDVARTISERSLFAGEPPTFLTSDSRQGELERWLAAAGAPLDRPTRTRTFNHFYVLLQAVLDGLGPAVGPVDTLAREIDAKRLIVPLPAITVTGATYYIIAREGLRSDSELDWLSRLARPAAKPGLAKR